MVDSPTVAVWHRDDLRIRDNAALDAVADGHPAPVFVADPTFYRSGMAADARLRFLHESPTGTRRPTSADSTTSDGTLRLTRPTASWDAGPYGATCKASSPAT